MPALPRVGDLESGHDGYEPVRLATGSSNVFINGRRAGRVGDVYEAHGGHRDVIVSGSPSIFINGRPAARVGDEVSGAGGKGTVTEGSGNVKTRAEKKSERDIFLAFQKNFIRILTENPNEVEKTILHLWQIAEAEAEKAQDEKDKIGWRLFGGGIQYWLAGEASTDRDRVRPYYVDWNWLLLSERGRNALDEITESCQNDRAKKELGSMVFFMATGPEPVPFNFFVKPDPAQWSPVPNTDPWYPGRRYFQHSTSTINFARSLFIGLTGIAGGEDVSLGDFPLRAIASGTVRQKSPGVYEITVEKVGVVLWDSFDFNGLQPLGYWNRKSKAFTHAFGGGVFLTNDDFQRLSKKFNVGQNFWVLSDVRYLDIEPFTFEYTLQD